MGAGYVTALELASPDVAFILHQENLDKIALTGTSATALRPSRAWEALRFIRPRLLAARVRRFAASSPVAADNLGYRAAENVSCHVSSAGKH